jgi:hypothetical protein
MIEGWKMPECGCCGKKRGKRAVEIKIPIPPIRAAMDRALIV